MRVIIAGSRRHWITGQEIEEALKEAKFTITTLVCGMSRGVDECAWDWAKQRRLPIDEHPAQWAQHGDAAGPIRNRNMVEKADALLAFPTKESKGTADVIKQARAAGLRVHVSNILTREK